MNGTSPHHPTTKQDQVSGSCLMETTLFYLVHITEVSPLLYIPPFYIFSYLEMVHNNLCDKLKLHNITNLQPNSLLTPDYATGFTKLCQCHFKPSKHTQSSMQKCSDNCIEVWVVVPPSKLKKATICAIPDSNEKGLCIRTERKTWYLTKEIDFLLLLVPTFHIKNVNEVCRFCHSHESSIRCVADWPNGSKVSLQSNNWFGQVPYVPYSASFILVASCKS